MRKLITKIYNLSPVLLQNIIISVYGFMWKKHRLGGIFKQECTAFNSREFYTEEQWQDYQEKELQRLLVHAFINVPFYNKKYREAGFTLKDLKNFTSKDLKKLPYLEKDELRQYGATTLMAKNRSKGQFVSSSGSTGTPTKIYFSKKFHQRWSALYETRIRKWAGVDHTMARAMIGGRRILPDAHAKAPFYRYNYFEKQTYFSAYHLSKETTPNYIKGLKDNKVEYLVGYAMSIYFLADFINQLHIEAPKLKAVLTSSEKLTDKMRKSIEQAFGCKSYDAYSGVEACGLISEDQHGDLLFSPDSGMMEVIDNNGEEVKNGESGEVIATGFLNYDQPLIRYRIGDRVKIAKDQHTLSDRHMPKIASIEGRVEDVIIGTDGRKMVRFHGLFIDVPYLINAQVIQHSVENIEIKLVTEAVFAKEQEEQIRKKLSSQLKDINITFTYVDEIPKNNNGKYQAVISKIK